MEEFNFLVTYQQILASFIYIYLYYFYTEDDPTNSLNLFDVGISSEDRGIKHLTLPTYTTNSINAVENLLDLEVDDCNHMKTYLTSESTTSFEPILLPVSSNSVSDFNKRVQDNYLGVSSNSDLLDTSFKEADSFYQVCQ